MKHGRLDCEIAGLPSSAADVRAGHYKLFGERVPDGKPSVAEHRREALRGGWHEGQPSAPL